LYRGGERKSSVSIFQDIRTAVKLTGEVRKARKAGASGVRFRAIYSSPIVTFKPAYPNTVEGCQTWKLGQEVDRAVSEVFYSLPHDIQRRLEFTPEEPGGWSERARFWKQQLRPVLPSEMYHTVMIVLIHWYIHCLRQRKEATA